MTIQPIPDLALRLAAAANAAPPPIGNCDGRGIVICAGGTRMFTCGWVLVAMLRRTFGCRLPIEVWHIGPAEMGPPMRALLEAFDVRVVDALNVARRSPVGMLGGWQLKTYAVMHSAFREVLLLDADNMPMRDPSFLFDAEVFADNGVVFWPDIVRLKPANAIWHIAGLPADTGPAFETGQLLIDKSRHWRALTLAHWINQNHEAFDNMLYGDKDACYVAWRMVSAPYHLVPHAPKLLEHTLCQRAPNGEVLFQHRNGAKWLLNGPNPRIEGFRFEAECLHLLSELRQLWDGTIFNPPVRSAAARAMERALIGLAAFRLIWVGVREQVVRLCPEHVIEGGNAAAERYWFVADAIEGLELRVVARGILSCALRQDADGIWRGNAGEFAVELHPAIPGYALGVAAPDPAAALLAAADRVLDNAAPLSGDGDDLVVTLATLASLDPGIPAYLETRATGPSCAAALAAAALARYRAKGSLSTRAAPGIGWNVDAHILELQSERVPKR